MNKKVADMIKYHFTKEKIIYKLEESDKEILYMIKSILRKNQTYNIVFDKTVDPDKFNQWSCDCPANKFKRRFKKENCKHVDFIKVLNKENIEIETI